MDVRRVLREVRELGRGMADPDITPPNDEVDGYELTVSARDFSKSTRKVVDEKLTFSAALLRAGEVDEANRILAEVEHDVRNEEAALLEKLNEVTVKRALRRAHITRMRLARLLATAMVGAALLGVSAMGMAVAGMFDKPQKADRGNGRHYAKFADAHDARLPKKKVMLGDLALNLSRKDMLTLKRLTTGSVDTSVLKHFLGDDLHLPPSIVDDAIATVLSLTEPVTSEVKDVVATTDPAASDPVAVLEESKKKVEKSAEKPADPADEPAEEPRPADPADEPTDDDETGGQGRDDKKGSGGNGRDGDSGDDPLADVDSL